MENPENKEQNSELVINRGDSADFPIIDSNVDRETAILSVLEKHPDCLKEVLERQVLFPVVYLSMDGKFHQGQVVVDQELQDDVVELFDLLLQNQFPVALAKPIEVFDWEDEASMSENNSSGYNHRLIKDTHKLSLHAFGFAFDINPRDNPVIVDGKVTQPSNGHRDLDNPHTLTADHFVVQFMKERGWTWGGDWQSLQDYHHFEKKIATAEYLTHLQRLLDLGYIDREEYQRSLEITN